MPCEMCGADAPLRTAIVEGTEMQLCRDCQQYGHTVTKAPETTGRSKVAAAMQTRAKRNTPRDVYSDHPEVLVADFGKRIRQGRQKKGLTIEELAKQLNEKKNLISKAEVGEHHPSDALARKLERALSITLFEEPDSAVQASSGSTGPSGPVTLGDLLKDALKKGDQ